MSSSELLVSIIFSFCSNFYLKQFYRAFLLNPFTWFQNHPFIKKFEEKDIDLAILVDSLDPPVNIPGDV